VVSVYRGSFGTELRCGGDGGPPSAYEQAQQIRDYGRLAC
jgi:hypothetical protein